MKRGVAFWWEGPYKRDGLWWEGPFNRETIVKIIYTAFIAFKKYIL
jgi:hypothetical protein